MDRYCHHINLKGGVGQPCGETGLQELQNCTNRAVDWVELVVSAPWSKKFPLQGVQFPCWGSSGLEYGLNNLGWETGSYELCPLRPPTLDGLNAEHKFRVLVTILGRIHITFSFTFIYKRPLRHRILRFNQIRATWSRSGEAKMRSSMTACHWLHQKERSCQARSMIPPSLSLENLVSLSQARMLNFYASCQELWTTWA